MPRTILTQTYDEVRRQMLHYVLHGHFENMYDWQGMNLIREYLFKIWNTDMAGNAPVATMNTQSFNNTTKVIVSDVPTFWIPGTTFTVTGANTPANDKQYTVRSIDGLNITVWEDMVTDAVVAGAAVPDGATATVIISSVPPALGYLDPLTWLESWFFVRYFTEKDGKKFENEVMYYYSRLL